MKKQFTNILNLSIIIGVLLVICGCKSLSTSGGKTDSDNLSQTNYSTADKTKTGSELSEEIIGAWETQEDKDKTRFTFGKDGSLVVKQEESAPQNATYSVLDKDAIEVKAEGKPKLIIIIKITGDTMRMETQNRGSQILKRIK